MLDDETVLFNEIAPRPHNSGHYTQEACYCDQFEAHLRAISDMPINKNALEMKTNYACMVNLLGTGDDNSTKTIISHILSSGHVSMHWYSKDNCKLGRKMGHFTVTGEDLTEIKSILEIINSNNDYCSSSCSNDDLYSNYNYIDINKIFNNNSSNNINNNIFYDIDVSIVMGSDSDLHIMKDACIILEQFNIKYECTIVSAHRTPTQMYAYAQKARDKGIKVIIAGAGGAAHLPGMIASLSTLPVIGVPIKTNAFNGNDSLLSIVQMPKGVPVATVAIDNATNAALLALRILCNNNNKKGKQLIVQMDDFMLQQENIVLEKADRLERRGYEEYLK